MIEVVIASKDSGQRLDKFLKRYLPEASTGFLYKMLRKKNITLNQKKASGNEIVSAGDRISFFFSDETMEKFRGNPSPYQEEEQALARLPMAGLKIIYEDEDILAADKPYNMLSQKAEAKDVSANEYLLGYLIRENRLTETNLKVFRPSVCNRLDRNTTGLILMGKTLHGSQFLSKGLKERTIQKYYRAIVKGIVPKEAHCKGYLRKDEKNNIVEILEQKKEECVPIETSYTPLAYGTQCTLLEVHLITGKTHQIRAHLAALGHPIIGDYKYGDRNCNRIFEKQFHVTHQLLHAYRVELPDGRQMIAETPEVFQCIVKEGRKE